MNTSETFETLNVNHLDACSRTFSVLLATFKHSNDRELSVACRETTGFERYVLNQAPLQI